MKKIDSHLATLTEIAKTLNINKSKLWYYKSMDIIRPVGNVGGMYVFDIHEIKDTLKRVKQLQTKGMSLAEISRVV